MTTTAWVLIALVPFERLGLDQEPISAAATEHAAVTTPALVAPEPLENGSTAEEPVGPQPVVTAPIDRADLPIAEVGPQVTLPTPDPVPTEQDVLAAIPVTLADLQEMRRAWDEVQAASTETTSTPLWMTLWILGALAVTASWWFAGVRLALFFKRCRRAEPAAETLLRQWAPRARLWSAPSGTTPFCSGFFRPRVVVPEDLLKPSQRDALQAVLAHEAAHLQQRDLTTTLLVRLCAIVIWAQPLFWILARRIRRDAERRADDRAAQNLGRATYARQLIELVQSCGRPSPRAALSMSANHSDFFRRMESLMKRETPLQQRVAIRTRFFRSASAGALCVAAVAVFGRDVAAQDPARMKRIEERLARLETRLESMTSLLEKIVQREVDTSLARSEAEAVRIANTNTTDGTLTVADNLMRALQDRQRLSSQLERTRKLAEKSYVSPDMLREEESKMQFAESRVELLLRGLKSRREAERAKVDLFAQQFERIQTLAEEGVVSNLELQKIRTQLEEARAQLQVTENSLQIIDRQPDSIAASRRRGPTNPFMAPSTGPTSSADRSNTGSAVDVIRTAQDLLRAASDQRQLAEKVRSSRPLAGTLISNDQFRQDEEDLRRAAAVVEFLFGVLERERETQRAVVARLEMSLERTRALAQMGQVALGDVQKAETDLVQAKSRLRSIEDAMRLYRETESKQASTQTMPRAYQNRANVAKARRDTKAIYETAKMFRSENKRLPTMKDLVKRDPKGRAYLETLTKDPWGNAYEIIDRKERAFAVVSNGPDGERGTGDDVVHPVPTRKND